MYTLRVPSWLRQEVGMAKAYCPSCDAVVSVDNPHVGVMVKCHSCNIDLEIISAHPFEVDFPLDYYDDWDDDGRDGDA